MNLTERLTNPDHLPDNVTPMPERPERREKPRWMERMEEQGLPTKVEFRETDTTGWAA